MQKYRRLEILGILFVSISIFVLASLVGYNANEEPSISPNIQIENPMGILGLYLSHYLIKLTFGFSTIILSKTFLKTVDVNLWLPLDIPVILIMFVPATASSKVFVRLI